MPRILDIDHLKASIKNLSFTAIDFETANHLKDNFCSVGVVVVENGVIVEKIYSLIKPYDTKFHSIHTGLHGLSLEHVSESPDFGAVFEDIRKFIDGRIILAHQVSADIPGMIQAIKRSGLKAPRFSTMCTLKISCNVFPDLANFRLNDVASFLKIEHTHHHALSDALVSAHIGINGFPRLLESDLIYDFDEITARLAIKASRDKVEKVKFEAAFTGKKINRELLKPDLSLADASNPFFNKKVVFTGDMKAIGRPEAAEVIRKLGADINTSISKLTNIVVIGEAPGIKKLISIKELTDSGVNIRIIREPEFLQIIKDYN